MRERLAKFMQTEGLSSSRFAEMMNVPPSSISHLLSGRNKPGFDFLVKLIQRFPKLSPDWIILGAGEMYRNAAPLNQGSDIANVKNGLEYVFNFDDHKDGHILDNHKIVSKEDTTAYTTENTIVPNTSSKSIERIIILYTDHSFIEYANK